MKKSLSMLIIAILLCCTLVFPAAADPTPAGNAGQDMSATSGVDVVIVLDASNSMRRTNAAGNVTGGNDPENYRLDATAMLIGMLDMNTSRVAVVPFNKAVIEDEKLIHMTPVNNNLTRQELIGRVYTVGATLAGGTDYGTALLKAVEILENEKDTAGRYKDNQPMIVLMTDGYNDMKEQGGAAVTATANQRTAEAVEKAAASGIRIYTVVLDADPTRSDDGGITMEEISEGSGAGKEGSLGTKNDVNKLPSFFAEVLAKRIGSSTTFKAVESMEVVGRDTYRVKLPLVNNSIKEANIIIPIRTGNGLDRNEIINSIRILKGEEVQEPYYKYDARGHFAIIKIKDIAGGDDWVLEYRNGINPGADISLLYNYNVKLNADLRFEDSDINRTEYYKDDKLILDAYFVGPDGHPHKDEELYKKHTDDDDWGTIKASFTIKNAEEELITDEAGIRLEAAENHEKFTGEIDLSEYHRAGKLPAGNYIITVKAEGAGLDRSVDLPITVQNRTPETTGLVRNGSYQYPNDLDVNLENEDQENGNSWGEIKQLLGAERAGGTALLAKDLVTDPDGEKLNFTLAQTEGADVLKLEKDADENGDTVIRFTTIQEDDQRKNRSGKAAATLTADDGDGGTVTVNLSVNVNSKNDIFWDTWDIRAVTYSADAADKADRSEFSKHQDVTLEVYLVNKADGQTVAPLEAINQVTKQDHLQITKPRPASDGQTDPVEYTMVTEDPNYPGRYRYTINTAGNATEWTMTMDFKGHDPHEMELKKVRILNQAAPALKAEAETGDITLNCNGDWALPFLGGIIGNNTTSRNLITGEEIEDDGEETLLKIDPKQIFGDADGDELTVSAPKFYRPGTDEEMPEDMIRAEQVGKGYRVIYSGDSTGIWNASYDAEMRMTAKDEDGLETTYTRKIRVQHLHNLFWGYALIALIVIAVLVILFLIIHQIRKPRFPMLNMTIREEPSLFTSGSETLSPVKTPTNVNAMGVDGDMAARHNISMELLQNVIVKPVRSNVSVGVSVRKVIGGHEVTLEDVKLKPKKQYNWKLEQELIIRNMNGEGMIAIKLEDRRGENENDGIMDAFGGDDSWSTGDTSSENLTYKAGKHTQKVKKKAAAPAEEENSFGGGNDDFDF